MTKLLIILLSLTAPLAFAQDGRPGDPVVEELRWVDNGFLERQRQQIDEITRFEYGSRLNGTRTDLRLLARIIDDGLINQTERQKLQAMGVALGDVFVNELNLQWRVYEDRSGKSRAVCLPDTNHCLFPVTMISRRMEAGIKPDPNVLYQRGVEMIQPYLPKVPYSSSRNR